MPVRCEQYNQVWVLSIEGDFTAETATAARDAVEKQIEQKQVVQFVLDFAKSDFADSEGLQTLLWLKRRCEEMFGLIKLVNLDENLRKILQITRLEHHFESHPDLPAALKQMS